MNIKTTAILLFFCLFSCKTASAQIQSAPDRTEGKGPYDRLVIRGVTLVDGTGRPPMGPVDIVVRKQDH
ncbi:MAG: hypothetical protein U5K69_09320 [Balneolaceae bacterium]|nr:hypothetical protein [Balneolaceae bacterium]